MDGPTAYRERLVALFALGLLLFSPPLLALFNSPAELFGLPLLYVYLFASWICLLILVAVMARGRMKSQSRDDPKPREGDV
jgi:hypothetical protein